MTLKKGFTLIELLIVMAILGVLAVVVLVAINPAEQMKRARDTGRISGVTQIGHAAAAYYTGNGYVISQAPTFTSWDAMLTDSKELSTIPAGVSYPAGGSVSACTVNEVNGWCYDDDAAENFVVYATLESDQKLQQCSGLGAGVPFAVFSSIDARGGVACSEPTAGTNVTDWVN